MYDNNSFNFNNDFDVEIIDNDTEEKVCSFGARENTAVVNNAGIEAGGIASGGQTYSIITNEDIYELIKPYSQCAIIDGVKYMIVSKAVSRTGLNIGYAYTKPKRETILYLE